jgi:hypothetical protein
MKSDLFWINKIEKKADLYKFIYDGLYSRDPIVSAESLEYIKESIK